MKATKLGLGVEAAHDGQWLILSQFGSEMMRLRVPIEDYDSWTSTAAARARTIPQLRKWVGECVASRVYCSETQTLRHQAYAEGYAAAMELG